MENSKSKSLQPDDVAVISLVNFRNYVNGYMSEQEIMNVSFRVPLSVIPVAKSNVPN